MSRSKKKHAITGTTCIDSEKFDKKRTHKTFRQKEKQELSKLNNKQISSDDELVDDVNSNLKVKEEEVSDVWVFGKDGKIDHTGSDWEEKVRRK
jgi:hypothetical protein